MILNTILKINYYNCIVYNNFKKTLLSVLDVFTNTKQILNFYFFKKFFDSFTELLKKIYKNISRQFKCCRNGFQEYNIKKNVRMFYLLQKLNDIVSKLLNSMKFNLFNVDALTCASSMIEGTNNSLYLTFIICGISLVVSRFLYKNVDNLSDAAKNVSSYLPNTNCAEGTETFDNIHVTAFTTIKHGVANSFFVDTNQNIEYASLYKFFVAKGISPSAPLSALNDMETKISSYYRILKSSHELSRFDMEYWFNDRFDFDNVLARVPLVPDYYTERRDLIERYCNKLDFLGTWLFERSVRDITMIKNTYFDFSGRVDTKELYIAILRHDFNYDDFPEPLVTFMRNIVESMTNEHFSLFLHYVMNERFEPLMTVVFQPPIILAIGYPLFISSLKVLHNRKGFRDLIAAAMNVRPKVFKVDIVALPIPFISSFTQNL